MFSARQERGFTFVEVLVVMLLIAILAAIALPQLLPKRNLAHDAAAKTNAGAVVRHVDTCFVETEDYRRCEPGEDPGMPETGLPLGTAPGSVAMTAAGRGSFRVDAHSLSGAVFTIRRRDGGVTERLCAVPAAMPDRGGCSARPHGTW